MNSVPLFFPLVAGAAHTAAEAAEHVSFLDALFESNIINFAIALFLIIWMLKKFNVGGILQQSRDKLKAEIESLESDRKKAEAQLAELKRQTSNLGSEISSILGQ